MAEAEQGPAGLAERLAALSPQARELVLRRIRGSSAAAAAPDLALPRPLPRTGAPLPASFVQERMWLLDRLRPGSAAYVVSTAVRLRGDLDTERLRGAVGDLTARHEVLRTSIRWQDDRPVQLVHDAIEPPWTLTDLSDDPDPRAACERIVAGDVRRGFDLAVAPLWRARLVRLGPRDHVLGVAMHHVITDAWSVGVLLSELGRLYDGERPPPLPLQYGDFAAWQRERLSGDRLDGHLDFWSAELAGAPELAALPTDRPRPNERTSVGARHEFEVPGPLLGAVRKLGGDADATPFMTLLALFATVLARWSDQDDVVVGTPVGGRPHRDLEELIGCFVNSVVMRVDVSGRPSFRELLGRVRERSLRALEHQDLPFEKLVEHLAPHRSTAYNPLFQVNFGLGNVPPGQLNLPGMVIEPMTIRNDAGSKFDLSLYLTEAGGRLFGAFEYATDVFDATTVEWLSEYLVEVLEAVADDPDRPVADLPDPRPAAPGVPVGATAGEGARIDTAVPLPRGFTEPRDRWERYVAQTFTDVLDVTPIDVRDDFFDLGGNSMAGMLVADRLHRLTRRPVTLADLFAHSTVEDLAARIRSLDSDTADAPFVVELQPGGPGSPLFFLHAVIGELYLYFDLAKALGSGRPLYGVQADGFFRDGADPGVLTMRQMADRYAEEICLVEPDGPYHLCGFSAAGRFALAVADSLHAAGREVGSVVLLDTAPLGDAPPEPDRAFIFARWLLFSPPEEDLRGLDPETQLARTLAAGKRAKDLPPDLEPAEFERFCRRLELSARAVSPYRPSYPGTATLLMQKGRSDRHLPTEWGRFPIGGLRVEEVEVESHLGFVHGPALPEVARRLEDCLEKP